jgi:hypothetical protein
MALFILVVGLCHAFCFLNVCDVLPKLTVSAVYFYLMITDQVTRIAFEM